MKYKEIKKYRAHQLKKQRSMCPLCNRYIKQGDAALDHSHINGRVRKVLHKNCNSVEGRILHWVKRVGVKPETFIRRLAEYWSDDYSANPTHPSHKTEKQKKVLNLKRRLRSVKKQRTKQKYRDLIRELQEN